MEDRGSPREPGVGSEAGPSSLNATYTVPDMWEKRCGREMWEKAAGRGLS
jgi:hypothetical protein